jgi:hypothetical protein
MGQDISAIITNQDLDIPTDIVHFIENGITIIPVDIPGWCIGQLVEEARHVSSGNLYEWLENIKKHMDHYDDTDDEGEPFHKHSIKTAVKIIEDLGLHTFMIQHESDHADIPVDYHFMAIIDKQIQPFSLNSFVFMQAPPENMIEYYYGLMGLRHYWHGDSARYRYYDASKHTYESFHPGEPYKSEYILKQDGKMYDKITTRSGRTIYRDLSKVYFQVKPEMSETATIMDSHPGPVRNALTLKRPWWKFLQ